MNIPVRHVLTMEDFHCGYSPSGYYGNVHGGVVYRWGQPDARILTHLDDVYLDGLYCSSEIFPLFVGNRAE
ncbi:MAG: hypothetical protein HY744_19135 [Deltaproteobacteria bacterium]|nr:hypothetical protein [Deltaproteobacteria bacterium]